MANINLNDPTEKRISLVYDSSTDSYKAQELITVDDLSSKGSIISNFTKSGSNGIALQANSDREELFIQNLQSGVLYVKYGESANSNSFNFVLAASTASGAGDGGSVSDLNYSGIVSVSGINPNYICWERSDVYNLPLPPPPPPPLPPPPPPGPPLPPPPPGP